MCETWGAVYGSGDSHDVIRGVCAGQAALAEGEQIESGW